MKILNNTRVFYKQFSTSTTNASTNTNTNTNNIFKNYWNKYLHLLETKPLSTKAITSGCISFTADCLCQKIDFHNNNKNNKVFQWDILRTFKYSFIGLTFIGPTLHFWYTNLFRMLPGSELIKIFQRLALDQFVFSPTFICTIMSLVLVLDRTCDTVINTINKQDLELQQIQEPLLETIQLKLKQEYVSTVQTSWLVWLPASFLNFKYVPVELQTLFSNCVGLVWNIYLSKVAHSDIEFETDIEMDVATVSESDSK